ncbi:MAG: SDR family NAD(P)-dependent oxidoreductase, partial [Alphaproteobacteria bacterium]|nr:SDR family NAD(P)-dependent oxidoreductase [Alphaproteobacteria bacterium]
MSHIAIITGGSRGIGAATARLAAEAGYDVCINYASDAEAARQVVVECETNGGRAIAVQADVADSADV